MEVVISNERNLRADIRYQSGGVAKFVDVTVINPTSAIYDPPPGEHPPVGHASRIQGERKIAKYVTEGGLEMDNFIPFVVEATGSIGKRGQEWIDDLTQVAGVADERLQKIRNQYLSALSIAVIRGNHKHLEEYRRTSQEGVRPIGQQALRVIGSQEEEGGEDLSPPNPILNAVAIYMDELVPNRVSPQPARDIIVPDDVVQVDPEPLLPIANGMEQVDATQVEVDLLSDEQDVLDIRLLPPDHWDRLMRERLRASLSSEASVAQANEESKSDEGSAIALPAMAPPPISDTDLEE